MNTWARRCQAEIRLPTIVPLSLIAHAQLLPAEPARDPRSLSVALPLDKNAWS